MLKAYFDDSGSHGDSHVVVVGGLVGTPEQWAQFDVAWKRKLSEPLPGKHPLKMFHLSHCSAAQGEFAGYTLAERDACIHDFRQVIIDAALIGFAGAIDRRAWNELVVPPYRDELGDDLDQCVCRCVEEMFRIAEPHPEGDGVAVVFDAGMWSPGLKARTDHYTYPLGRPRIVSITTEKVIESTPLQGADIVATENYWHALQQLKFGEGAEARPHFQHLLKNMITEGVICERTAIEDLLEQLGQMDDRSINSIDDIQ